MSFSWGESNKQAHDLSVMVCLNITLRLSEKGTMDFKKLKKTQNTKKKRGFAFILK